MSRLTVALALIAFLATSLATPFGRVCLCLSGGVPVAVGSCCCDRPATSPCDRTRTAGADARGSRDDASPSVCRGASGHRGELPSAADPGTPCAPAPCCPPDDASCIDLHASGEPAGSFDVAANRLPAPDVAAILAVPPPDASLGAAGPGLAPAVAWPARPAASPPPRPRVMRC